MNPPDRFAEIGSKLHKMKKNFIQLTNLIDSIERSIKILAEEKEESITRKSEKHHALKDATIKSARVNKLLENELTFAKDVYSALDDTLAEVEDLKGTISKNVESKGKGNIIRIPALEKTDSQHAAPVTKIPVNQASNMSTEKQEEKVLHCLCKSAVQGEMIGCDGKNCSIEWFHPKCVGIKKPFPDKWFCAECMRLQKSSLNKMEPDTGIEPKTELTVKSAQRKPRSKKETYYYSLGAPMNGTSAINDKDVAGKRKRKMTAVAAESAADKYSERYRVGKKITRIDSPILESIDNFSATSRSPHREKKIENVSEKDRKIAAV